MRLQKFLAHAGVASRRKAEELILGGAVRVNGRVVRVLGTTVQPDDRVMFNGKPVEPVASPTYLVLHKPTGMMTTMRDPEGRRTVTALLPAGTPRVVPVGRLDYDTSGVLLMTNDGELAHVLTHPRFGVEKTYRVTVRGALERDAAAKFLKGIALEERRAAPARVRVVARRRDVTEIDVTIHEGRNREIRRMFESLDHPVVSLVRLRFGPISLGALPAGRTRPATEKEVSALRRLASAP